MTVDAPSTHKATSKTAAKVDEIAEALQVFHDDGELIEIRGFIDGKWLKNASGYFTDPRKAAEAFVQFATTRKDTLSNANSQVIQHCLFLVLLSKTFSALSVGV